MKKTIAFLLLLLLSFQMTGCINLGIDVAEAETDKNGDYVVPPEWTGTNSVGETRNYDKMVWGVDGVDYSEYYGLFDGVTFVAGDRSTEEYDVEDSLFTEDTCLLGEWGDDDTEIPSAPYLMMAVKLDEDVELNDFFISVLSDGVGVLETYFFLLNDIPDRIPMAGETFEKPKMDLLGQPVYDGMGNAVYEALPGYYYPDFGQAIAKASVSLNGNDIRSLDVTSWIKGGKSVDSISVGEGQYLGVLFYTNTGFGSRDGKSPISFSVMNMVCRIG